MKSFLTIFLSVFTLVLFAQPISEFSTLVPSDGEDMDLFGEEIALSGDYAFITAKGDRTKGSVYVFKFESETWTKVQKFSPDANDNGAGYGNAVSITEDYAIVGFAGDDEFANNSGSAIVYKNNNGTWEFDQKLLPDTGVYNDRFGYSVDVFGNYALVGVPYESGNGNFGAAYIYLKTSNGWELQQRIIASSSSFADYFGLSVAITEDYAFIGAPSVDHVATNSGIVYVFKRTNNTWTEVAILSPSDAGIGYNFGFDIDVSGQSLAISAADAGVTGAYYGFVYLYELQNGNWVETQKLEASDKEDGDEFGASVSLSCHYLLVGARYNEEGGFNNGAAYFFKKVDNNWTQTSKTIGSQGGGLMGMATAISCDKALVGVSHNAVNGSSSGLVYSYIDSSSTSVTELKHSNFTLFPNPADDMVTITIEETGTHTFLIYNATGQVVHAGQLNNKINRINLDGLSQGFYHFTIKKPSSIIISTVLIKQ